MWSLGERDLFAVVNSFQERPLLPSRKGTTLTLAEWTVLKNHLEDIDRSFQREIANLSNERKIKSLIPDKPDLDHIDYTPSYSAKKTGSSELDYQGSYRA